VDQLVDDSAVGEEQLLVTTAERLWTVCSQALRTQVTEATWRAWFDGVTPLRADDRRLVLAVPSAVAKERIEGRFLPLVRDVLTDATGLDLEVVLEVHAGAAVQDDSAASLLSSPGWSGQASAGTSVATPAPPPPAPPGREETPLNPRYTFDAFVIGASNRFAHAAALSVAETPAKSYNPLFIHGFAGLGKTHLLHAIGNYVRENFPARHVRYVSTETFMNEFVDAIRTNTTTAFKRRYRECDVLLVDDIQFMENKEGLQEEFFHTFNSLYGASKQIVITDVQPPELETRLAILRKKAEGERAHVPDEVLEFIATNVKDNIRELEGALIRVSAFASLNREPLTRELAEKVLSDLIASDLPRQVTPKVILDATAEMFGFPVDELCGTSRRRPLVTARQVGMYVFRELTDFSYPAIAREFGGRDHTTVIHAVDKISGLMKERRQIYDQVTELIHRIKSGG
jgi:chromosomal replication initiator protein